MRTRFIVSGESKKKKLALIVKQSVASEIYLNGILIEQYGRISINPQEVKAFDPQWKPLPIILSSDTSQIIAVRFAVQPDLKYTTAWGATNPIQTIEIASYDVAVRVFISTTHMTANAFFLGIYIMMIIVHLSFYLMYAAQKANLYITLYGICSIIFYFSQHIYYRNRIGTLFYAELSIIFMMLSHIFLFMTVHRFLENRSVFFIRALLFYYIIALLMNATIYDLGWKLGALGIYNLSMLFVLFISYNAMKQKKPGGLILFIGVLVTIIFSWAFLYEAEIKGSTALHHFRSENSLLMSFLLSISTLAIPAAVSIILARDFATTSKKLGQKLKEVETLSEINMTIEKEKQEILLSQNIQLEEKVNMRTEALNQSLQDLKSAQAQLVQSEKMASLGELTAGIAHEIQNPLNFVNNFSELSNELIAEMNLELDKGDIGEVKKIASDISQNLAKINHHGKRADSIVKGMLAHSQSSSGNKEQTDINVLADEYLRLAYHGLKAKDKSFSPNIKTDFDLHIGRINIVPQDIGRVILNLVNNALYAVGEKLKKAPPGYEPTVWLQTRRTGEKVEISVRDNGNGIPEKIKDKIFQPFFTTKPTGQGTGLGLSLSYDIVKAHGGELTVNTREGEFTEFIVGLPINFPA
nr:ATP-binding protein [Flavihumibacter fluvii]